jgi:hypothetical protein
MWAQSKAGQSKARQASPAHVATLCVGGRQATEAAQSRADDGAPLEGQRKTLSRSCTRGIEFGERGCCMEGGLGRLDRDWMSGWVGEAR